MINDNDTILFQGDSITDCERDRSNLHPNDTRALGWGYAGMVAEHLLASRPAATLRIYNRGVSGDRVPQLADRWQTDCLDLAPHVLSILVGVNDMWHRLMGSAGGTVADYERAYRDLLERTRRTLPSVRLIICEPFIVRCGVVDAAWLPEFDERRAVARDLAAAFDATFVRFQKVFDEACTYTVPTEWASDGVHPTPAGHRLMADEWLHAMSES